MNFLCFFLLYLNSTFLFSNLFLQPLAFSHSPPLFWTLLRYRFPSFFSKFFVLISVLSGTTTSCIRRCTPETFEVYCTQVYNWFRFHSTDNVSLGIFSTLYANLKKSKNILHLYLFFEFFRVKFLFVLTNFSKRYLSFLNISRLRLDSSKKKVQKYIILFQEKNCKSLFFLK